MCERCNRLRDESVPQMMAALAASDDETIAMLGRLLSLVPLGETTDEEREAARERVNEAIIDTYAMQRRDLIVVVSWLVTRLTALNMRLQREAQEQGDRHTLTLQWQPELDGFLVVSTDEHGIRGSRFFPRHEHESPAQAANRIAYEVLDAIGEIHQL